jgi:DnaK suppressor protein
MPLTTSHVSPLVCDVERSLHVWRNRLHDEQRFRTEQIAILNGEISANPQLRHEGVTMALRRAATIALGEVEAALTRLDAGDFGRCTCCAQTIPMDRLDVLPMTALCMPCQYQEQVRAR